MESSKEPISVRVARINSNVIGKTKHKNKILNREALLDALQALYDECSIENLQKYDANIAKFVQQNKQYMKEIKSLRVNITDFEIKCAIGRGHFGEVHLVKEKQTGDIYAMKSMKKSEKSTSFEEERHIMAFGSSQWLTSLQYAFQDSTQLFFVMEYHAGGDLLGLLYRQGGTLPESASTFYVAEVFLALVDLHAMGFVHRDIKPDNILLDRCGHIKLADFGSAARLNDKGMVTEGPPVGTPDYIAPEVLRSFENDKNAKNAGYGVCCDFWSLGVLAYELTIGNTPFTGQNTTSIYNKIMNHSNHLKFPPDVALTQAYTNFIKGLVTDQKSRLNQEQIKTHPVFRNTKFDRLIGEVPPYVPKITSPEDTSNFTDVVGKKKGPSVENFKRKTQFSGRNLPFVGFTFTHDPPDFVDPYEKMVIKNEAVQNLRSEVVHLQKKLIEKEENITEKNSVEKKLEEKTRKLESLECLRNKLERDVANNIAECTALKRTLELERKDRIELERKALDLIKAAKAKWETSEKSKTEALSLELQQQKEKINELTTTNKMLNEQLKRALQTEVKHKESLETVQNLSRRSVVGLESRLEKITNDSQNVIHELQTKLSVQEHEKGQLRNEVSQLTDKCHDTEKKLRKKQHDYDMMVDKMTEAEETMNKLTEKLQQLESLVNTMDEYKEQIDDLKQQVDDRNKKIKDLENNVYKIEQKTIENNKQEIEEVTNSYKKKIRTVESQLEDEREKITSLNKKLREVESRLMEEQEKNMSLKKQLKESENTVTESQELKELRTKFWRVEKELSNFKIDKRILERELKEALSEITQYKEKEKQLNETINNNKKAKDAALYELSSINESLTLDLMKTKDSLKSLLERLNNERKKSDDEETIISELKKIVVLKNEKVEALEKQLEDANVEKNNLEAHLKKNENEKQRLLNLIDDLRKEKSEINNRWEMARREVANTNLNLEALREACTLLENQVIEYEKITAAFHKKETELNSNTEKLIKDLCAAKTEIRDARKLANEEKSLKLLAETNVKRCKEDVECLQNECKSYKDQCVEYKQYSSKLAEELTVLEEKITDLEATIKNQERHKKDLTTENIMLKEELAEHLTNINTLKEHNYKVNHQLRDVHESRNVLAQQLQEFERLYNEKMNYYKERELKSESTINQQIKLIDFLQTKVDEHSQKKRTISDRLFGISKKENVPPPTMAMNYKDLEQQLAKERQQTKLLREEVHKLKSNPKEQQIVAAMSQIVNSPSKQKGELLRQNSAKKRMHHNIPHRFETKLCTKQVQCYQCSNMVLLGRNYSVCQECAVQVHSNCAMQVPRTCGLPKGFADHFRDSLTQLEKKEELKFEGDVCVEGWIKIPNKMNAWDKCYARMSEEYLEVYTGLPEDKSSQVLDIFELKPKNSTGKVILEPVASEIGVPVASSDLPFIIKLEIHPETTCWPVKCFVLMTLSAQDKDRWYQALQNIFEGDLLKEKAATIFTLPEDLKVNCLVELSESIKLLGTDKGLYSLYEDNFLHIEGPTTVQQIAILQHSHIVAMIIDHKSILISCELNHLINLTQCAACTKPTLKFKHVPINNLTGFHLLQASRHAKQQKICAATSKQLVIFAYDDEQGDFIPERILDTAEPTGCVLFTENSVIVGADKYFEIDLSTYEAEEFLDLSDSRLKQASVCHRMGSFPLAIIEVSHNPREYLLCFNEFSVFVDEYGRSSRPSSIKPSHLPLAFHYTKPYLFIVQFCAVELLNLQEDANSSTDSTIKPSIRVDLGQISYLGPSKRGVFFTQGTNLKYLDVKMVPQADESLLTESDVKDNDSVFSFTSSMVQSLDGNLSDDNVEFDRVKKVTFSQTDL